jgi:Na+/H+ antiporter NhaA
MIGTTTPSSMQNDRMTVSGHTAWRGKVTPLREFLETETGGAAVLLGAAVAALTWVNIHPHSYSEVWETPLSITVGNFGVTQSVRGWINGGLMTFFFFVVGLEARREFDLGELRARSRLTLPLLAGLAGMIVPIGIFLAFNAGETSMRGWGAAMSTDTAFALGLLALVDRNPSNRLRVFLLTVTVVDDIVALIVIGTVYSGSVKIAPLLIAVGLFAVVLIVRGFRVRSGPLYFVLGVTVWVAVFKSGVDPIVVGLAMGLLTYAYPARREVLERATDLFRAFREQPTPELAASARQGVRYAISPNERLQQLYHPWTSYVIVPLFALANAGVALTGGSLARAYASPITLGILIGYIAGKPTGIAGLSSLVTWLTRGRLRPNVGWVAVVGGGAISGIGFTVALLVASIVFTGQELAEAKIGILSSALAASLVSGTVFRITGLLPRPLRARALLGRANQIVDLSVPVDKERDHIRGPHDAPVTLVEYGDFECPYCGQAEPIVRELLAELGDVRYVWRHLPLTDVHPRAQAAAEAAEAAAAQEAFWEMHDVIFKNQDALAVENLVSYAEQIGLDVDRFRNDIDERLGANRVAADVESADLSTVSGTPTFFINGRRHYGAYDIATLKTAVKLARLQAGITSPS